MNNHADAHRHNLHVIADELHMRGEGLIREDYQEANAYLEGAGSLYRLASGDDSLSNLPPLVALASTFISFGERDERETLIDGKIVKRSPSNPGDGSYYFSRARYLLTVSEAVLNKISPEDPLSIGVSDLRIRMQLRDGSYRSAIAAAEAANALRQKHFGADSHQAADGYMILGKVRVAQAESFLAAKRGDHSDDSLEEARVQFEKAREIYAGTLGTERPECFRALQKLSICFALEGKYQTASLQMEEALNGLSRLLGEDHPWVDSCRRDYQGYFATPQVR